MPATMNKEAASRTQMEQIIMSRKRIKKIKVKRQKTYKFPQLSFLDYDFCYFTVAENNQGQAAQQGGLQADHYGGNFANERPTQ